MDGVSQYFRKCSPALLSVLALTLPVTVTRADWISAAGGNSARTGYVDCIGPDEAERVWDGAIFTRYVRPILVADGIIYAPWNQAGSDYNLVVALDLQTGEELWSVELPEDGADPSSFRCRPSGVRDGQVYLTRATNNLTPVPLYAYNAVTGEYIWTSEDDICEYSGQSCSFTPGGDIIIPGGLSPNDLLLRIDGEDGHTVWSTPVNPPTSDAIGAVVRGDRVYSWDWRIIPPSSDAVVSAFDLETGELLYTSQGMQYWGAAIQHGLFIGLDDKVYAPRASSPDTENYLYALEDTGDSLEVVWTYLSGYGWSSTFGVGPDGSIYSHDLDGHLVRLDSDDGSLIARTLDPLPGHGVGQWFDWSPRLAVDSEGKVFVSNGSFDAEAIAAYDSDLNLLWTEDLSTQSITGPALASTGELVVQTRFQGIIVYQGEQTGVADHARTAPGLVEFHPNQPNPFGGGTSLSFTLREAGSVRLSIHNLLGQRVRMLQAGHAIAGTHRLYWDGRDDRGIRPAAGLYIARVESRNRVDARKLQLVD